MPTLTSILASMTPHGRVSETVTMFIVLLGGAAVVGVLTKFIKLPYTIALVLAGLVVALSDAAPPEVVITHDLIFVLFLPPLLFQAGLHLDIEHLQRKARTVVTLAIPGVILSMFGVALAIMPFLPQQVATGMSLWLPALLFGAMFAPTDPISVLATFKTAGAPEGLKTLVEGESLFNDGTGVVLFMILLAAVFPHAAMMEAESEATGETHSALIENLDEAHTETDPAAAELPGAEVPEAEVPEAEVPGAEVPGAEVPGAEVPGADDQSHDAVDSETEPSISIALAVQQFVKAVGLGLIMGLGLGLVALWLLKKLDDHVLENSITVVLVWGSYIMAESIHGSGVIAVVVAGLIMGNYGHRLAMSPRTSETINTFWESIDFIVNSIVFLLIGFELQEVGVGALIQPKVLMAVGVVYLAMMLVRAIMVYPTSLLFGRHWPSGWKHVVFWAGMKGSIPMALVLGLPTGELKTFLVPVAFGLVLVSLLLQGLTMPLLMRAMGVTGCEYDAPRDAE